MSEALDGGGDARRPVPKGRAAESSLGRGLRIAYLSTLYPAVSHTFIEREVRALRANGVEIETFAVRRPSPSDLLGKHHAAAARTTTYLLGDAASLVVAHLRAVVSSPLSYLRTFLTAQRISPPGIKARALHCAYFVEAVFLAQSMQNRGLHHIHVHFANNGAVVALLAARFDRRITYSLTVHGPLEFNDVDAMRLTIKAESAAFVRCISNFCRAQVMMWTEPSTWSRSFVAHCGIFADQTTPNPPHTTADIPVRILALGRLAPMKGFHLLLQACRQLSFPWRLDLVGDGELQEDLTRHVQELGIADHVRFHGALGPEQVDEQLEQTDIYATSSFLEGLPVSLMEAMSKGLPVVATRVAGIPELVEHGVSGILVDAGDADALARAIARLGSDPELRERMGRAGRARVLTDFSVQCTAETLIRAFRMLTCASPERSKGG